MRRMLFSLVVLLLASANCSSQLLLSEGQVQYLEPTQEKTATSAATTSASQFAKDVNPGTLQVAQIGGKQPDKPLEMPLQHTDVQIEISGFVASVTVTQRYQNPFTQPIEAVYTFPLPHDAAVDDMQMTIGSRVIKGLIKRREEAREIYEKAKKAGQRASLLEQERPNIFTQTVANILPGDNILITIHYVNILQYADGSYELAFPMVVGPRYIPGDVATGTTGTGWSPDTNVVPDASRITPPVLKPGERSGHDIALSVKLDAGVPIQGLRSTSHALEVQDISNREKTIRLRAGDTLPNKDFILRYEVAGKAPEMATIAHHDDRGGFFTLIIQPQRTVADDQVIPRELIFIVDTSGSMTGFPLEKSKQAMQRLIKGMRATDTFNVVRFSGDSGTLWEKPQLYTSTRAEEALRYVSGLQAGGGTEMRQGILEALAQPAADGYLRIAFLLTDGYVGDELRILQAIEQERRGARVFSLGVGSSPNRYLLDKVAKVGRGEAFYVRQDENSEAVINQFFARVDKPALAFLEINWGKLDVSDLFPQKIPDLWAGQPVRIHGRYTEGGDEDIVVRGRLANQPYEQKVHVQLPKSQAAHAAVATVWARQKIEELMDNMVSQGETPELVESVTKMGLTYKLMTQWTSFVAVEEKVVNEGGESKTVVQPVEMPEGVSYEGVFGKDKNGSHEENYKGMSRRLRSSSPAPAAPPPVAMEAVPSYPAPLYAPADHMAAKIAPKEEAAAPEKAKTSEDAKLDQTQSSKPATTESAAADSEKKQAFAVGYKVVLPVDAAFVHGSIDLTESVRTILDDFAAKVLQNLNNLTDILVTGYTDSVGTVAENQRLSEERAQAIANYLIARGIPANKVVIEGKGEKEPIADNKTEDGRAKNQRVVLLVR